METIILDGLKIENKDDLFNQLHLGINNEEFIGNNLDALYDYLSYTNKTYKITIKNFNILVNNLGNYALSLEKLLIELNTNFSNIKYEIYK